MSTETIGGLDDKPMVSYFYCSDRLAMIKVKLTNIEF